MSEADSLMIVIYGVKWFKLDLDGLKKFAEECILWIEITETEVQISNRGTHTGDKPNENFMDVRIFNALLQDGGEKAARTVIEEMNRKTKAVFSFRDLKGIPFFSVNARKYIKHTLQGHLQKYEGQEYNEYE